jgi:hypothetical protein
LQKQELQKLKRICLKGKNIQYLEQSNNSFLFAVFLPVAEADEAEAAEVEAESPPR